MDNGSTVYHNEFARMMSDEKLINFSADLNSGNVRILATPQTGVNGSITIRSFKTVI